MGFSYTLSVSSASIGKYVLGLSWTIRFTLTDTGVVGKVQKNYLPKEEGREGREKSGPRGPGLELGTSRMLGKGPQLYATVIV